MPFENAKAAVECVMADKNSVVKASFFTFILLYLFVGANSFAYLLGRGGCISYECGRSVLGLGHKRWHLRIADCAWR
jgi:hypothetical protein